MTQRESDPWRAWPRLYLDTAEILRIADDRAEPTVVSELTAAMLDRKVGLIISVEHLLDSLPRVDANTSERVADALEKFRWRFMVLRGPTEIEPWQNEEEDIEIAPVPNIREVLRVGREHKTVSDLSSIQDLAHSTNAAFQRARVSPPAGVQQGKLESLVRQCLVTLIRGWRGTDAAEILDFWARENGIELPSEARDAIRAQLQPFGELMRAVGDDPRLDDAARMRLLLLMGDSLADSAHLRQPGMFLATRVTSCRMRNIRRVPLLSDTLDGLHVMYFPYVDIVTCDRQTYACVATHAGKIFKPRRPTIIRNGRLEDVLAAVLAIPAHA